MRRTSTVLAALIGLVVAVPPSVAAPAVQRTFKTGGQVWSSPVHDRGTIYIGSDDGCLWALEAKALSPKWKIHTGGRVRSTPAVAGGSIYFTSDDGFLYKVSATDGKRSWRFDLDSAGIERVFPSPLPPYAYDYLSSSPTVAHGTVFVGSANGKLYAIDADTGKEKWQFKTGARIRSTPVIHQERVYVGSWDHHLYALNVEDGKQAWSFDTGGIVQSTPTVGDGRVYVGSRNPKIFALDAANGKKVWEHEHADGSWVESSGVFREGTLYIGSSDSLKLFAFDGASGRVKWTYRTGGWSWGTPSIAGETIYIGSISASPYYFAGVTLERGLHAVDLGSGERRWRIETGELPGYVTGGVMSTPLVVDGEVVAGALDNRVIVVADPTVDAPQRE
ncbi:MAG: PQQ-binding-like beta-propeller repeat protein [bacterium]|nr:PQQ-binding-like beta-propeller repeat protein [bacterium]